MLENILTNQTEIMRFEYDSNEIEAKQISKLKLSLADYLVFGAIILVILLFFACKGNKINYEERRQFSQPPRAMENRELNMPYVPITEPRKDEVFTPIPRKSLMRSKLYFYYIFLLLPFSLR